MIPRFSPWLGWPEFFVLFKPNKGAVEKFEKEFAKSFQAVDAVAFPYGRSAQWAFFKAMGVENAEVIMPAYTCSVVAHAVTLSGNTPRFVDIDLHDYNMNLDEAELKDYIIRKIAAQEKLAKYLDEQAQFLSTPGNTLSKWLERGTKQPEGSVAKPSRPLSNEDLINKHLKR
jgi:hypothetical protein